jgi:hypothetical protein
MSNEKRNHAMQTKLLQKGIKADPAQLETSTENSQESTGKTFKAFESNF